MKSTPDLQLRVIVRRLEGLERANRRWKAVASTVVVLLVYGEQRLAGTGAMVKRPTSSLLFFDQDDAVIWHAP